MKLLINMLAAAVRRAPVMVVAAAVIVSMALGAAGGDFFAQDEGGNDAFAPDAPELLAADRIGDLFGDDSSESVIQVVIGSDDGDVISPGGLATVDIVRRVIADSVIGDDLSERPDRPAFASFLFPVEQALAAGGLDAPASDDALDALYLQALADLPPEQAGFVSGLLPEGTAVEAAASPTGLMVVFVQGVGDSEDFDAFIDEQDQMARDIAAADLPEGFSAEPFSFELIFASGDEFQAEVGRLFLAALFIILTILALVFVILPGEVRSRALALGGFALLAVTTALLVLEVVPPLVPLAMFAVVFLGWTYLSPGMRRTTADTLLTIVVIIFAINWVAGAWAILYGEPNPMTQIIPILLIGLGVDYSIHLTSRYRDEASGGVSVDDAIAIAIRTVGVALVLATITTAVGFLTNLFNEIPALQQFGALAAVGIIASFVLMLTLVPAVRLLLDRRGVRRDTFRPAQLEGGEARALPKLIGRTSGLARQAPALTVIVALVLGALGAWGVTKLETKFSVLDFVPTTSPLRDTFATLLDDFGGGFGESAQVLIEGEVASGEAWNAMVSAYGNLGDTRDVLQFGDRAQAESPLTLVAQLADPDGELFSPDVGAAAAAVGLGPDLLVPAENDVTPLYEALYFAAPERAPRLVTADFEAVLFDIATQAGETGAGDLRQALIDDFEPVRDVGLEATPTSDEIINDVIINTLRDSQVSSLFITLAAALLLLVINFTIEARRPLLGVITTVPVVLVVLWSFAIMALLGIPFGPVTATISALAIGIGIPYMIHITHRYQEDRVRLDTPAQAIHSTLTHTGGALAGSGLTTMAGFGILVTSTTIPFQQFGLVTAYTIGLALLAAVLIQPSMLVLWDRWHQGRGEAAIDADALQEALDGRARAHT